MNRPSGYQGVVYQNVDTKEVVVAHRGTEPDRELLKDGVYADGGMVLTRHNAQAADAIELTQRAIELAERQEKRDGLKREVTVTGHSLGGGLTQFTAHHFGLKGQTFNAYGATSLDRRIPEGGNEVINHVMAGDVVSAASWNCGRVEIYVASRENATLKLADHTNDKKVLDACNPLSIAFMLAMATGWIRSLANPVEAAMKTA
ncbi:hypothetical protein K6978_14575 [Xanthomonas cucurbitae]|uniref:Fungal lipase-like domain-containing protein n=2 Tax=Xanthomonas cucurbitae TaxID=56453 RepID=A0ABY7Y9S1_9XANT|nr:hypothetical protein EBN15_13930 [Xanthomonas cucurbitae]WDM66741.1 hypothetical protein K6981_14605 [Xanthomonas cucurbitae]WDM70618.1 hypothetical protein K6978_14575 [Xanthomonas cucurbitae]WDM74487.1 hypothetical protein K6982_13900 [Xanthomonas cucurbitae]